MSKYEKKPCPICGKMVSEFIPAWKGHAKTHVTTEAVPANTTTQQTGEVTKSVADKMVEGPVREIEELKDSNISSIKDPAMKALYKRAIAADRSRAKAPEAFIDSMGIDERKKLVAAYAPECLEEGTEWEPYFGNLEDQSIDVARGCIPKFNEFGEVVGHKKDPLYVRRKSFAEAERLAPAIESQKKLYGHTFAFTEKRGKESERHIRSLEDIGEDELIKAAGGSVSVEKTVGKLGEMEEASMEDAMTG